MAYVVKTCGSTKLNPTNINIDGSEDPFYRYRMRQLFVQVVGKGKMIKTVLLNVDDVAKDLKVAPSYMTSYIGYEIGAQSKYDGKKPDRERASISGERDTQLLNDIMEKFIKEFVLCPHCRLPETSVDIDKKTSDITYRCHGCGQISVAVLRPKFKTYILNHPQDIQLCQQQRAQANKGEAAAANGVKKTPKKAAGKKKEKKEEVEGMGSLPEEEVLAAQEAPLEAAALATEGWAVDTSAAAVAARKADLPDKFKALVVEDESVKSEPSNKDYSAEFRAFVTEKKPNPSEIAEKLQALQSVHQFTNADATRLFCQATFKPGVAPPVKKLKAQLAGFVCDSESRDALLGVLELLLPTCIDKVNVTLKSLYDADLLDEDGIIKWANTKSSGDAAKVKAKAAPFVKWLKEAEEESSEEEEEEDE